MSEDYEYRPTHIDFLFFPHSQDVTIGLWLHGVDRAIFPLNDLRDARLWECSCKKPGFIPANDANVFFHHCKSIADLRACKMSLPMC